MLIRIVLYGHGICTESRCHSSLTPFFLPDDNSTASTPFRYNDLSQFGNHLRFGLMRCAPLFYFYRYYQFWAIWQIRCHRQTIFLWVMAWQLVNTENNKICIALVSSKNKMISICVYTVSTKFKLTYVYKTIKHCWYDSYFRLVSFHYCHTIIDVIVCESLCLLFWV